MPIAIDIGTRALAPGTGAGQQDVGQFPSGRLPSIRCHPV
jgi:hypothetical protein